MTLFDKLRRDYIIYSIIILLISGVSFYLIIKSIIKIEIDEELVYEKNRVLEQFQNSDNEIPIIKTDIIEIQNLSERNSIMSISDTLIFNSYELVHYRQIKNTFNKNKQNYLLTIRKISIEDDELVFIVFLIVMLVFILLLSMLFYFKQRNEKRLFEPFYDIMNKLSKIRLTDIMNIEANTNSIVEFDLLKKELNILLEKLSADFRAYKEFTEETSHELQTPLTILKSQIDVLLQKHKIDNELLIKINSFAQIIDQMSSLIKSLNLINKIDNHVFGEIEEISLIKVIEVNLERLDMILSSYNLVLNLDSDIIILTNPYLIKILCSNLIMNAINHNNETKFIKIDMKNNQLILENSGDELSIETDLLFKTFKKGNLNNSSSGLGLSIVKRICEQNNIAYSYKNNKNLHKIILTFTKI
jgi:signal transduction histidine kinase